MFLLNKQTKFFSPDDNLDTRPAINSAQDILNMMEEDVRDENEDIIDLSKKKDDTPKDDKDDKKEEDDKKEAIVTDKDKDEDDETDKKDDLSELEDELEEDEIKLSDEDELEFVPMPRRKEILAKYPKFFEEFPGVERAYFRDQKFSEYFPTPKDAELAFDKAKTLDNFEKELLDGNTISILKVVKEENQESYNKIIDNYLPSLKQIDEKAYFHVVSTIIKGTVYNMVREARDSNDETLQEAARILNKFVFNTEKWTPVQPLSKGTDDKVDPRQAELDKKQQEFETKQFQVAFNGIQSRVKTIFERTIEKNIDPKDSMSPYIKKNAIRDAHEELDKLLDSDARFKALLTKAWEKARESSYDDDSMDRVLKIVKSRASSLMPQVIKKARVTALKGSGIRTKEKLEDDDKNDSTDSGESTSSSNRGPLKKETRATNSNVDKTERDKMRKDGLREYIMAD